MLTQGLFLFGFSIARGKRLMPSCIVKVLLPVKGYLTALTSVRETRDEEYGEEQVG